MLRFLEGRLRLFHLVFIFHYGTLVECSISNEWHYWSVWFKFRRNSDENSWIYSKWWVLSKLSTNAGYSVFWAYPEKFILVFLFGNSIWNAPWPAKPQHNILFFHRLVLFTFQIAPWIAAKCNKTENPFSLIGCGQ